MTRPTHSPERNSRLPNHAGKEQTHQVVSGRWLVKALVATLLAAGAALYLTVCLLFYQGQWQFVFFPPRQNMAVDVPQMAAATKLPITDVKFDYTEQGIAHLDGWWVPAVGDVSTPSNPSNGLPLLTSQMTSQIAVLYCPNGRTTLRGDIPAIRAMHSLGVDVLAFDYRGFGGSEPGHPSQKKAYADGMAALRYLTETRHIARNRIVVYGTGVGAAVAVAIAQHAPEIAGLVLENPRPSFVKEVKRQQHIHVLPLWLIFPGRFDILPAMRGLKMPKLLLATSNSDETAALYRQTTCPKWLARIPAAKGADVYSQPAWQQAMRNFLH